MTPFGEYCAFTKSLECEQRRPPGRSARLSGLLAGYLLLLRQGPPLPLDAHQIDLMRRGFALVQLSLPRDEFPNLIASAEDTAEVGLSDPDRWWRNTVDLITFGLERMIERGRDSSQTQQGSL